MKLYWASFIINGERPYLLSHSIPYRTLNEANESVKKATESFDVILSYIQEQDVKTKELTPVVVTPYVNSLGLKK